MPPDTDPVPLTDGAPVGVADGDLVTLTEGVGALSDPPRSGDPVSPQPATVANTSAATNPDPTSLTSSRLPVSRLPNREVIDEVGSRSGYEARSVDGPGGSPPWGQNTPSGSETKGGWLRRAPYPERLPTAPTITWRLAQNPDTVDL